MSTQSKPPILRTYQITEQKASHDTWIGFGDLASHGVLPMLAKHGERAYRPDLGTGLAFWDNGVHPDYAHAAKPVNDMVLDYVVEGDTRGAVSLPA